MKDTIKVCLFIIGVFLFAINFVFFIIGLGHSSSSWGRKKCERFYKTRYMYIIPAQKLGCDVGEFLRGER